jgi:hypothetical protein
VPLIATIPLHAPAALHDVALAEVQVRVVELPASMVVDDAFKVAVGKGTALDPPPPHADASREDPVIKNQKIERTESPCRLLSLNGKPKACL